MNGQGPLPSYCRNDYPWDVRDIREVSIGNADWLETQDHSKVLFIISAFVA